MKVISQTAFTQSFIATQKNALISERDLDHLILIKHHEAFHFKDISMPAARLSWQIGERVSYIYAIQMGKALDMPRFVGLNV